MKKNKEKKKLKIKKINEIEKLKKKLSNFKLKKIQNNDC